MYMEAKMQTRRKIIRIDEGKCNGCGQCVIACAEGAIEVIDGKARLVSEAYCDGLGACIGDCPQGAIVIEEREAETFDEKAVEERLRQREAAAEPGEPLPCGCPSAMARTLVRGEVECEAEGRAAGAPSRLSNWPVQIQLVPPHAPYLEGAKLLIAADCVPFAFADFHRRFLAGRALMVGCPKLDDAWFYRTKLAEVFAQNAVREVEVVYMEVPCCAGLVRVVRQALEDAGKRIPLTLTKIAIRGEVLETEGEQAEEGNAAGPDKVAAARGSS
jgi:NAD-dependent dihydropyrimidine dehydrogenase PreA subunit